MTASAKRLAWAGIASLAFALGALAQGLIQVDNSANTNGVAIMMPGHYYTGTFGMEVWELNAGAVPAGINNAPYPVSAYSALWADGFKLEATYSDQAMINPGTFTLGEARLPDAPAGGSVVLGLAVWNTSAASWDAMLTEGAAGTRAGVIAFVNPTVAPVSGGPPPVPAPLSGWTSALGDLVMVTPLPEPGALPLAGLGVATLLLLSRGLRGRRSIR